MPWNVPKEISVVSVLIEALSTLLPKADAQALEPGTPSDELVFGSFVRFDRMT
jgi:hypothetical protein